jgi:hypothetical protein
MNIIATTRVLARHRGKTPTQLKVELDQLTCRHTSLLQHFEELAAAHVNLNAAYKELDAEVRRLTADNTGLRAQLGDHDTTTPDGPEAVAVDYLNTTRHAWTARPLHQAPLARTRIPTDPARIPAGETTQTIPVRFTAIHAAS